MSESGGKTGNITALRYSLPSGLSSDCICITGLSTWYNRRDSTGLTTLANSAKIFEHRSASKVPIYIVLWPIMFGITTSPGKASPTSRFELLSLSSKTRQVRASGKREPWGDKRDMVLVKSLSIDVRVSPWEFAAIPTTPKGKSDGRNNDRMVCVEGGGCDGYRK